jgi:hypothetical protein
MNCHRDTFLCEDIGLSRLSIVFVPVIRIRRSQWPRVLRLGSTAARLLRFWVPIPPGAWMSVSCVYCVLSGRAVCVRLITCPEESYRVWCVWVWSWSLDNEEALAHWGCCAMWGEIRTHLSHKAWRVIQLVAIPPHRPSLTPSTEKIDCWNKNA